MSATGKGVDPGWRAGRDHGEHWGHGIIDWSGWNPISSKIIKPKFDEKCWCFGPTTLPCGQDGSTRRTVQVVLRCICNLNFARVHLCFPCASRRLCLGQAFTAPRDAHHPQAIRSTSMQMQHEGVPAALGLTDSCSRKDWTGIQSSLGCAFLPGGGSSRSWMLSKSKVAGQKTTVEEWVESFSDGILFISPLDGSNSWRPGERNGKRERF